MSQSFLDQLTHMKEYFWGGGPDKAVLMISITQLVHEGYYKSQLIVLDDMMRSTFLNNWHKRIQICTSITPDIDRTFLLLTDEPFVVKSMYKTITIDEELIKMMRERESSERIVKVLTETYLSQFAYKHRVNFAEINPNKDNTLRPYQTEAKRQIYKMWSEMRSIMFQMPTGTGKTKLFTSIARDLFDWGAEHKIVVRVLFMAHRKELIHQISESVGHKYNLAHGLIASQTWEQKYLPLQVSSVQTLVRRLDRWEDKDFDVIIIDEAHHVKAESYKKIIKTFPRAKVLGVTATPYRLSHESFRPEFDELITSMPVSKFIEQGFLCDYEYYSILPNSKIQKDINDLKLAFDGDFLDVASEGLMDKDEIRAKIVSTYERFARGKKGIVYTITKRHNLHVCNQFVSRGYKAVAIDDSTPAKDRTQYVDDFRDGKIDIICNVNIFSEGFDCPDLEFIQLARPTKSLSMFLQQVGRGLRPAANKDKLIILDNVGLYNRFGFPSARRHWRHHFEGKDIDYAPQSGGYYLEGRDVNYFDEFDEGDEVVEMLHSTEEEVACTVQNDDLEDYVNEKGFRSYMINTLEEDVCQYKRIIRGLKMDVDDIIRMRCDHSHSTIFEVNDASIVDLYITSFQIDEAIAELDAKKNYIMSTALKHYYDYLKWKSSDTYVSEDSSANEEPVQEELPPRSIEEVEQDIAVFRRYGYDIPQKLTDEYNRLVTK